MDASQLATLRQESTGGLRARVLAHPRAVCADRMDPASSRYFDFRERRNDYWRLRAGLFTVLPALNALTIGYAAPAEASTRPRYVRRVGPAAGAVRPPGPEP